MQLYKEPKNGFLMAKQGLSLHGNLKTNLVSNWGGLVEKKEGERRRDEEEEDGDQASQRYGCFDFGMETHLDHEVYVIMYEFPCYWMVVSDP